MNSIPPVYLVLLLSMFLIAACGPAQRTADGNCYYAGKGALRVLGTIGDATSEWADAVSERRYQREQIELAELKEELQEANIHQLVSEYRRAVAEKNTYRAIRLQSEINLLTIKADRAKRLIDSIKRYQERRQRALARGPRKSFSQIIDESGDCD